jgi:Acetyltransferase (GNAT) family.
MAGDRDGAGGWSLRACQPDDREAIREVWGEAFGSAGDEAEGWLDLVWGDGPAVAPVAEADGQVVGFAVVAVLERESFQSYLREHDLVGDLPNRVSVIHMLGVRARWHSSRVGTALVGQCLEWAAARTDRMVVVIWEREDHVDSTAIAETFDFERVDTLPGFYEDRTDCPDCHGGCTCPAALYVRDLEE